jgi:3-oxoacyl-[acyl-carrier protein] reductase
MMGRLEGKTAVVTGAAAGIGRAIAARFAAEGATVVAVDRREEDLVRTAEAIAAGGGRVQAMREDVGASGAADRIVETCLNAFGALDVLVNNAGIGGSHELLETSDEEWDRFVLVNLTSVFRLCRRAVAEMCTGHGGRIINISSVFAAVAYPGTTSYSAAKAALIALTRSIAVDYAGRGVTVNAIAPGLIVTDMTRERLQGNQRYRTLMLDSTPLGRPGSPEDVAGAALFLASDDATFITGQVLTVDGGWSASRFLAKSAAL